jgi:hypothetical protein
MMDFSVSLDAAALFAAIAWPAVLLFFLYRYRDPMGQFLGNLSRNPVQSLEVPWIGVSLQFAIAEPMSTQDPFAEVFRQPSPFYEVVGSDQRNIIAAQLKDDTPAVYAVIDLGEGKSWLSSRLYILALLLRRMRNVHLLVFVETNGETRQHFVGFAETRKVRWALAQRFIRLEEAFGIAYSSIMRSDQHNTPYPFYEPPLINITSREGRLAANPASTAYAEDPSDLILQHFLEEIQLPYIPDTEQDAWVQIPNRNEFEYAIWLDASLLKELLGKDLVASYMRSSDLRGKPNSEQVKIMVSEPTPYIALTLEDGKFEELIQRQPLLERVVENVLRSQVRAPT